MNNGYILYIMFYVFVVLYMVFVVGFLLVKDKEGSVTATTFCTVYIHVNYIPFSGGKLQKIMV